MFDFVVPAVDVRGAGELRLRLASKHGARLSLTGVLAFQSLINVLEGRSARLVWHGAVLPQRRNAGMSTLRKAAVSIALAAAVMAGTSLSALADMRIAVVAKFVGGGFWTAVGKGSEDAAKDLGGGVQMIFTGPSTPTAEGQIEIINSLVAQKVDAIAISANDPDAVVPALKKAMARGIVVISYDSGVAKDGRQMHLDPSSVDLIGQAIVKMVADQLPGGKGQMAFLSGTPTAQNQNEWIAAAKSHLSEFPGLTVVDTVYGDDQFDKSYRETQGLIAKYPDLKAISVPSATGILAASQAVEDAHLTGKIIVTGLGLPSEMAAHVKSGASKSFAIWNPVDLGYAVTEIAYHLVKGDAKAVPGATISMGRVGNVTLDANTTGAMAPPYTFDSSNIDKFAAMF